MARAAPSPTVSKPDASGPPLRSVPEAIDSSARRLAAARGSGEPSDLEKILATRLTESRVGFVNGHHFLESELRELGHISYALNPLYNEATNGLQRFLVFGNSPNLFNYRAGRLDEMVRQNSDRAVWAVNSGVRVATVIQVDNDLGEDLVRQIIASRAKAGFRDFVIGNEFNDPGAHWRYNLPRLLRLSEVARETLAGLGIGNGQVYTPAVAYIDSHKHLDDLLAYFKANARVFPADGVAENYYGSVDQIREHLEATRAVMRKHRLGQLRLRIGELGSPTDSYQVPFGDEQLAYNYFPQAIALMLNSPEVDELDVYSTFDFDRNRFSLAYLDGTVLKPKPSLVAARLAARVFARVRDVNYREDGDVRRVIVERTDGKKLWVIWSNSDSKAVTLTKPKNAEVFGALGNRLDEDDIVLTPRPHPALAGTVKYVLLDD